MRLVSLNKAIMHRQQAGWTNFPLLALCFFRYASTKQSTPNLPHMATLAIRRIQHQGHNSKILRVKLSSQADCRLNFWDYHRPRIDRIS